jgi:hypothetical protein
LTAILIALPPESFVGGNYVNFAGIVVGASMLIFDRVRSKATARMGLR